MSMLILFGITALAVFAVLVTLFILVLVLGQDTENTEDHVDDEAIEEAFHEHGVRFG
ncbi:hypothetical protein [Actinorugispora endophytica]|uniref:Uncharacterized protein n=1 Tax=Actinorugispora endophytica TaxID=1605990 RepID=A0A4R6UHL8_9ACTN|nr:hypothetical protein [Actinorugispora endophytica]TDQ45872.1 hypothetical protein EV190_12829 [Actinorugispora endophytica]